MATDSADNECLKKRSPRPNRAFTQLFRRYPETYYYLALCYKKQKKYNAYEIL